MSTTAESSAIASILLVKNSKRYGKFEVVLNTELTDLSGLSFVLLVEIAIGNPISPVLFQSSKNILKKFPSWMALTNDSLDQATPDLYVPKTVAGKFINALAGENLDEFDRELDLLRINSFLDRADQNQTCWFYSSENVSTTFHKILANGVELTRIDDLSDFFRCKKTDYVFYHNAEDRQIFTLIKYHTLVAKNENFQSTSLSQAPVQKFNWFDELGLRVGVTRLHLEDNLSFKKRILDASVNPSGIDVEAFKKTLRRELNLWKAFSKDQIDSVYFPQTYDYLQSSGSTPEVLEMSDIIYSTPYFFPDKNHTDKFVEFVKQLNVNYPNNWGYFKFDDSLWDYAGLNEDGVSRLTARYYDDKIDHDFYRPGIGDQDDLKLSIKDFNATPIFFQTNLEARGIKKTGSTPAYHPINMEIDYYSDYRIIDYDNPLATINYTLEFHATPHGLYSTPTVFYSTQSIYPKNTGPYSVSNPPQWIVGDIFDTEGFVVSDMGVKNKNDGKPYSNTLRGVATNRLDINHVTNILLKLGLWNGSSYVQKLSSDSGQIRFSNLPNNILNFSNLNSQISATPFLNQSTKIQAASNLWNQSEKIKQTIKQDAEIILNPASASPPVSYSINVPLMINTIPYPPGATPRYVYVENKKPTENIIAGIPSSSSSGIEGYGGYIFDPNVNSNLFVPSSPNVKVHLVGGGGNDTEFNPYFSTIKFPHNATPNQIVLSAQDGSAYPKEKTTWLPFVAYSTPITGYVDEYGFVGYRAENGEFIPSMNSDSILIPEISRETFGISGSAKFEYFFESISMIDPEDIDVFIWSEQKIVNPFLNKNYTFKSNSIPTILADSTYTLKTQEYPKNAIIEEYVLSKNTTIFKNIEAKGKLYDSRLEVRVNTGWLNIGKEQYYAYSKPKKQIFTGRLKELTLDTLPKAGAPIEVVVKKQGESTPYAEYKEIAFEDLSTPSNLGFFNVEILRPSYEDEFYLAYKNVYDVSIVDAFTGRILFENLSSNSNILSVNTFPPSATPIFSKNHDYQITYRVRNSYYIDNILNNSEHKSIVVFDATPDFSAQYEVTYEQSQYEDSTPISLSLGQVSDLLDQGFILASKGEYEFESAVVKVSHPNIMDDSKDYMIISIVSLDSNKNPKPGQSFQIQSTPNQQIQFYPALVTTNEEGYALSRGVYNSYFGPVSKTERGSITVAGVGGISSFSKSCDYSVHSSYTDPHKIVIVADPAVVKADGLSSVFVEGLAMKNNVPMEGIVVYWKKSRTPFSAVNKKTYTSSSALIGESGTVITGSEGKFTIGPIFAMNRATPGYWYLAAESEFKTNFDSHATPIAGDVTYWYESYDNVDLNYVADLKVVDVITYNRDESLELYSTPSFITSYYDEQLIIPTGSTPRWTPPKWLPISRYEQYQAGLLGSTPYYISDYKNLKKDN